MLADKTFTHLFAKCQVVKERRVYFRIRKLKQ